MRVGATSVITSHGVMLVDPHDGFVCVRRWHSRIGKLMR